MAYNPSSVITNPTIFGPFAEKLDYFAQQLNLITNTLNAFDPSAYNSLRDFVQGFKGMKSDLKKDMSQLSNTFETTQAALHASIAAKSPSGAALAMKGIVRFLLEVKDFVKCITKITEIIGKLVGLIKTLAIKVAQLTALLVKLAMDTVLKYLNELKVAITAIISDIKSAITAWVQTHIFDPAVKKTKQNTFLSFN